jgi:beta-glucosidase
VWFGGQELGHAVADVLFGDAEPGGRLPTTFPQRLEDSPAFLDVPGGADVVRYSEGVFVGHRWYDARSIEPAFGFGHGLTYTTFAYGPVRLSADRVRADEPVDVDVDVTNTGGRPGSEVVQVYLGDDVASVRRPVRELAAFAKVRLAPGETRTVRLTLPPRARRYWDATAHRWTSEPGRFTVWVGASSRDLRGQASFEQLEG